MIDCQRLINKCAALSLTLTAEQTALLDRYAKLLVETNRRVNLTAITEPEGIEDKHFIDSLLLAAQPEIAGRVVDVGTGAGFPGIVAKIYKPDIALTLMEPTGKRLDFLRRVVAELSLAGVEFAKERAEEAARKAISSPLLETSINGAKGVLVSITGSSDIGLDDVEAAAAMVQQAVHPDANTIFGAAFDESMDDEIRVTVIATGFDEKRTLDPVTAVIGRPGDSSKDKFDSLFLKPRTDEERKAEEKDPFDDIMRIFNNDL